MTRGVFTLSLDFELIWGTLDLFGPGGFSRQCTIERETIIARLLAMFSRFDVSATWLVVGHLFLDRCERVGGRKHPDIVPPHPEWFGQDPDGTEPEAPLFLGRTLVEKIRACSAPQEIGSHSFSHVIFGEADCTEATARTELDASVRAAREVGIDVSTFSFPRNSVGHLAVLAEQGFKVYRGPDPVWYHHDGIPGPVRRLGHLCDVLTTMEPPTVIPRRTPEGLVDVPGSMVYFPRHGIRRFIPMRTRVRRALKGLDAAVRDRRVFHLWMHPTNLADDSERMIGGLETILERAADLRARGLIDILTLGDVAARVPAYAGRG